MKQDVMDTAKGKIQKICDTLKNETIEPAKQEAKEIVENAHMQAEEIVEEAQMQAKKLIEEAKKKIEEQRQIFDASLLMAKKQSLDFLKQEIEKNLFDVPLQKLVTEASSELKIIQEMIRGLIGVIEEKGIDAEISAVVPKIISAKEINKLLGQEILQRLRENSVVIGDFNGGIQIKMHENEITLDITDEALKELIAKYIRKDFREIIFKQ